MQSIIKLYILSLLIILSSCGGKYDGVKVDSEDVSCYVSACTKLDTDYKDFLLYIQTHANKVDSTEIQGYSDVVAVLNASGFIDMEYFMHVHANLKPVLDVIRQNPDVERYPGIGTADFSFLEEGEKQYRQFLEDNTLSNDDKEFYRAQMAQIETTKVDLFDKQEKNQHWVELVRKQSGIGPMVELSDIDIMQLTILDREMTKL